jgi:hypothetical protein
MNAPIVSIPLCIRLFAWLALCSVTNAFAASLTISPAMGGANTVISVKATGLSAATSYTLEFVGSPATNLGSVSSDPRGMISTHVTLPALPVGGGKMRLKTGGLGGGTVVAYTVFTALPSMSFTPQATGIHAGQSLAYTVGGLSPGSLTVLYEGQAVVGPLAVSSGSYHGKFVVPIDRPAALPANADITVINKTGKIVIGELDTTLAVLPKLNSPFQIGITQPPPTQVRHGQHFDVSGQFTVNENEAPPEQVSLWFFGDNGQVFPLGAAQATVTGHQYQYSLSGNAAGGLSMTASPGISGAVSLNAPSHNAFGMPTAVVGANTHVDPLPDDHWQVRVHVTKQNGQPIAGALVQFDGAPVVADTNTGGTGGSYQLHSIQDYVIGTAAPTQYQFMRATDDRGCPLTLSRRLTDANGNADFEFLDEDLAMAQAPIIIATAGGQIEQGAPRSLRMAIDASAQGYGFQFASGPYAGLFLPHIYLVQFIGAGDGDPVGDQITFTDYYQNVLVQTGNRNTSFPLSLPPITPMVGLYDTSILPWVAKKGPLVIDSGGQSNATNRLIFGPVYSELGISPAWVHERSGEGFPSTIAVRTDPAVTSVSSAKLYLDMNRDGTAEFISNFSDQPPIPVDCSIDGLNATKTWRATLPDVRQQASGQIKGYVEFIGNANAGKARQYIGIDIAQQDVAWLRNVDDQGIEKYSDRQIEFSAGGQRIGVHAIENTKDAQVQLAQDPGYQIGRLKNSTDNTRLIDMFFNNTGSQSVSVPLDGAHKEAGRNGSPTLVEPVKGQDFHTHDTLIDQSFPLFYYVWGVPVLAGVSVGADFALLAEIDVKGKYILKNLEPQLTVTTTPSVDLGLDFYVDLDVLFDLVDGGVDLDAIFSLDLPITIDADHPNGIVDDCFGATLLFRWHFEVFCLPLDFICDAINDIEGQKTLLAEQDGSGCSNNSPQLASAGVSGRSAIIQPMHTAVAYSSSGSGFLAFTRDDNHGNAPPVLVVRPIDGADFGRTSDDTILSTAPGIRSVDIEFYQDNKAVMVWAESDRDYATLVQLSASQRLTHQRLMYATFDGETWSAKAALTTAHGGEGGVDLAACTTDPGNVCPANGEVLAVWTRDTAGDIFQHRTRVYSSRFNPTRGWTTPTPVDATAVLDSSPSAAYVDAKPVVAFVRSTSGDFADTDARRIAYRFLDSSSNAVQIPPLQGGAAWPSIVGLGGGKFAIAHTHESNAQHTFVGNTQRVALGNANACANGVCSVAAQVITDANGRPIYGEHPTALVDESGNVTVVMRGMGFGAGTNGSNVQPNDPIGMALHTGELISFAVDAHTSAVTPVSLSDDGAGHFAPSAAYDPELGHVVAASTRGAAIPEALRNKYLASGASPAGAHAKSISADANVLVFTAEQGVDFALEKMTAQSTTLNAGHSFPVNVVVRNAGQAYTFGLPSYQVRLSWDAPYDAGGVSAATHVIPSLEAGEANTMAITVTVPAGFTPDQSHRLYATVFRNGSHVDDVQSENDQTYISFGGMPMPFGLNATAIPNSTLVQLTWDPIDDPQHLIAGYRIWCHDGDGKWRHLGSSFELGFLDVGARDGVARHYRVTSYSKNAIESPPSSEAVATAILVSDTLFANGFE